MKKTIFLSALLISGAILISGAMIVNTSVADFLSDYIALLGLGFIILGFFSLVFMKDSN